MNPRKSNFYYQNKYYLIRIKKANMKKNSSNKLNKDLYPLTCLWHA